MESGLMALSIYCAQMAPKWSCLLELRPRQGKYMSVQVYYDQFFNWKKKLEEINYIGDEESYIDDFLFGLKMDLAVSVWRYKWKPRTLYGAFRRAEIEETMISWKELSRKNEVDKVLEEMSQPNSFSIADTIGAEGFLNEDNYNVVDASGNMTTNKGFSSMHNTNQLQFPKAKNGMADEVKQPHSLKLDSLKDVPHMFDEMPRPFLVEHNEGIDKSEDCVLPFGCIPLTIDLGYDVTEVGTIYGSYKSRFDGLTIETKVVFGKSVVGNQACYVFEEMSHPNSVSMVKAQRDRSIMNSLCSFKKGDIIALSGVDDKDTCSEAMGVKDVCDSPFPDTIKGLYGLWGSNAVNRVCLFRIHAIELETYECKYVISFSDIEEMFYFDPGGCSFSQMGSDPFEFNGEKGEFGLTLIVVDTLIKAIKHKCKDDILLVVNAAMFYFDPGGCICLKWVVIFLSLMLSKEIIVLLQLWLIQVLRLLFID